MQHRSRSRSRSRQCSGDALANRLKLLLKSQKNGIEKRAELATLLKEITGDTSDSVIEEMTNSVVELKDDTELQAAFLNGMTDNLVDDKLTTSGKNVVLNAFTNQCGNLNRVGIIERAFEILQGAQTSPDKRPQTPEDSRVGNCGGKQHRSRSRSPHHGKYAVSSVQELATHGEVSQTSVGSEEKVQWLVDQTKAGYAGYWKEATLCGPFLEKQYQNGDESADVEVGVPVQFYRYQMEKDGKFWQIRVRDPQRSQPMFESPLARAIMQTSRHDQSQSDPDGAEAAGCGKGYKWVVPPTPMDVLPVINGPPPATPKGNGGTRWQVLGGAGDAGKGGGGVGGGGQGWQEPNAAALVAGETVVGSGGKGGGGMGEGGQDDGPPLGGGEAAGPTRIAAHEPETAPTTPVYRADTSQL